MEASHAEPYRKGYKSAGIGGVTREEYGRNLDRLMEWLKRKSYRPQLAGQVEIPKENKKTRPLTINCYGAKLAQETLGRILEAVYKSHFCDGVMGFRSGRSCHMAVRIRVSEILCLWKSMLPWIRVRYVKICCRFQEFSGNTVGRRNKVEQPE